MVASLFMSAARERAAGSGGGTKVSRRARVLLIAESPALARAHAEHLRHASFDAEWAMTDAEAISAIRRGLPDVVLLDMQASGADSCALLRLLKDAERTVGIVMVTTADSVDRAVAAMHQGAHDFIVKPVGATKLVEAVRKAVHRVSAERRVGRPDITLPRLRSEAMDVSWPDPAGRSPRTAQGAAAMDGDLAAVRPLWMVERETIETAIAQCRGNISRAAGLLEISASTIYRKRLAWEARERGRKSTT